MDTDNATQSEAIRSTTRLLWIVVAVMAVFSVVAPFVKGRFTPAEAAIIHSPDTLLYVLDINERSDSSILRTPSADIPVRLLRSEDYALLCSKMLSTVKHPSQDGVGIAAPQIGIDRRVAVVQRFDKQGEPFEVYANVRIDSLWGEVTHGPEGCLSVPPMRGLVPRFSSVKVSYTDISTLKRVSEEVSGYTAIIFQHECDHLDGRLYTDRADTVFTSMEWAAERAHFDSLGFYRRK